MKNENPRSTARHRTLRAAGLALVGLGAPACGADTPDTAADTAADSAVDVATAIDDALPDTAPDEDATAGADADTSMAPLDLGPSPDADHPETVTLLGDTDRPATLVPPTTPAESSPLLVLLHGHGASGAIQDAYLDVSSRATARGFYVALPDGTTNRAGNRFWNAEPSWCCDFDGSGVDDTAYLGDLIEEAVATLPIDPDRVYLLGHSNGAYMAHRIACARADLVTGIATIAGGLPYRPNACAPSRPVANLVIHGTLDPVVLYFGQPGLYPGADETASRWASYNGCGDAAPTQDGSPRDLDGAVPGPETLTRRFTECPDGAPVVLWQLTGSGHVPAFRDRFLGDVLDFLDGAPEGTPD